MTALHANLYSTRVDIRPEISSCVCPTHDLEDDSGGCTEL